MPLFGHNQLIVRARWHPLPYKHHSPRGPALRHECVPGWIAPDQRQCTAGGRRPCCLGPWCQKVCTEQHHVGRAAGPPGLQVAALGKTRARETNHSSQSPRPEAAGGEAVQSCGHQPRTSCCIREPWTSTLPGAARGGGRQLRAAALA